MGTVTTSRALQTGVALVWLGAAVGFFVLEAVAAAAMVPPYNYADHYISALGVPARSPRAAAMNTALYAQGILFFAGAVLVVRGTAASHSRLFLCLVAINTVGNIAVATVHQGSADSASGSGWLHGVGAGLAIVAGNAAIVAGSACLAPSVGVRWYRGASVALAGVGFVGLLMLVRALAIPAASTPDPGVWERMSVYSTLIWQILSAVLLLTHSMRRLSGGSSR